MNIEKPSFKKICLMHIQALTNFPYIEKDFDAITDYELICKVVDYLNEVIKNSNDQNTAISNLYNAFIELKDYVDNYFDNNFPELVNDKLDEMAEDGTLENLLNNRLKLITVYHTFDDVIQHKNQLSNKMIVRTLGYYEINDGGGADYYITNTASETDYQENLDNDLYATMIISNSINIKQFGVIDDGESDNTLKVNACISAINDNVKEVIFNNKEDLVISDIINLSGINDVTFNFKGKIYRLSGESATFCFQVWNCKNLTFNNSYIYSTRDKQETPPQDHTRVSPYGSNIIGYYIGGSENIVFNNVIFERMMSDFYNQPYQGTYKSKNVIINNWYSRDSSLPLFMQYIDNVYIDKADLIPANNMGGGDHFLYFSHYVDTVYVTNSKFKNNDTVYGTAIQFYNSGSTGTDENCPKNLTVDNCDFNICARVTTLRFSTNAKILNSNIYFIPNETTGKVDYIFTVYGTSELLLDNCKITGYVNTLWSGDSSSNVKVSNCVIKNSETSPANAVSISSGTPKLLFINNKVKWDNGFMFTSVNTTPDFIIKNNYFNISASTTAFLSMRKSNAGNLLFNNNTVIYDGEPKNNFWFIYNGGLTTPGKIDAYFNQIKGFTDIGSTTEKPTINNDYNVTQ